MPLPRYSIRQFGPRFPVYRPPSSSSSLLFTVLLPIIDNPCSQGLPMHRTRDRRFVDLVRNDSEDRQANLKESNVEGNAGTVLETRFLASGSPLDEI